MLCGIYIIKHYESGMAYIGQSIDIERRWKNHKQVVRTNPTMRITKALKHYGIENFSFEILEECSLSLSIK